MHHRIIERIGSGEGIDVDIHGANQRRVCRRLTAIDATPAERLSQPEPDKMSIAEAARRLGISEHKAYRKSETKPARCNQFCGEAIRFAMLCVRGSRTPVHGMPVAGGSRWV